MTEDGRALAESIGEGLIASGETISVAESCTGGLIGYYLTSVPGSSAYFPGGLMTYSYEAKSRELGVDSGILEAEGAVSEVVVRQMVEGVRKRFGTTYGLAVSGVAGPGGGTPEKPVGLVYIALMGPEGTRCRECHFEGDREAVRQATVVAAFELLRDALTR